MGTPIRSRRKKRKKQIFDCFLRLSVGLVGLGKQLGIFATMSRGRSPGYPNLSLPEAIGRVRKVFEADRRNPIEREIVAKHIGYSGLSGAADKAIASLMHYDLLERVGKGEIRVSQLAVDILHPETDAERKAAVYKAAFAPEIFQTLHAKFPDRFSAEAVRSFLMRSNYLDRAIEPVVSAYTETCQYLEQEGATHGAGLDSNNPAFETEVGVEPEVRFGMATGELRSPPQPTPPAAPIARGPLIESQRILTSGMLSKGTSFEVRVVGPVGVKEIETLIRKLEIDKDILAEELDDRAKRYADDEAIGQF